MKKIILLLILSIACFYSSSTQSSYKTLNKRPLKSSRVRYKTGNVHKKKSIPYKNQLWLGGGFSVGPGYGTQLDLLYFTRPKGAININIGYYGSQYYDDDPFAWMDEIYYVEDYNKYERSGKSRFFNFLIQRKFLFGSKKFKPYFGIGAGMSLQHEWSSLTTKYFDENHQPNGKTTYSSYYERIYCVNFATEGGFIYETSRLIQLHVNTKILVGIDPTDVIMGDNHYVGMCLNFGLLFNLSK